MTTRYLISAASLSVLILIFGACGNDNTTEDLPIETPQIEDTQEVSQAQKVFYTLPSPFEVAALMQSSGATYDETVMNPAENVSNYSTKSSQALNLGIYGADLSYASIFDQTDASLQYLKSVRKLTDKLGITDAFSEQTMKRIEDNQNNRDSLQAIVSEAYLMANAFLKENESSSTSALILAGGWIEGLYIAAKIAGHGAPSEDLLILIAEQKYSLENLIELLKTYDDPAVSDVLTDLQKLNDYYSQLDSEQTGDVAVEQDESSGMTIIGGGSELSITPEQLEQITQLTSNIRDKYING